MFEHGKLDDANMKSSVVASRKNMEIYVQTHEKEDVLKVVCHHVVIYSLETGV